jgi:CheY-like chemotaxis protein
MARRVRIVTVDDEVEVLRTLTEFLTSQGYEAVTAQSAREAFTAVAVAPPDVILLDIHMPHVGGVSALKHLRVSALRHLRMMYPHVPVVMVTANPDVELAREALQFGAFDYVTKPFDFLYLARVLAAAVGSSAPSRA